VVCGLALTTCVRRLRASPGDRISLALLAATLAYLLTCLAGHPLLVMEAAVPFWIATGLAASTVRPVATRGAVAGSWKLWATAAAIVVFALGVSLRPRIQAARDALHLEHVLVGGGRWQRVDGVPEVEFRGRLAVYVPGRGNRAWIAVRPAGDEPEPIQLTLRLDGRLADVVRLDTPTWRTMALLLPTSGAQRFRLLQLEARWADGSPGEPRVRFRRVVTQR
jgi:hypothetical protein